MSKYRTELKVRINTFDKLTIASRLSSVLQRDSHANSCGNYIVRSLYFDDIMDSALNDNLIGIRNREKFRVRLYNKSTDIIKLEKKVKHGSLGYKETALLSLEECHDLVNGDYNFLRSRKEAVCKSLYSKVITGLFKPKTIVEYEREAYTWEPGRIRITIDSLPRTGMGSTSFLDFDETLVNTGEPGESILEIKYDSYLPSHIRNLVQLDNRDISSVSKYVLCRKYG